MSLTMVDLSSNNPWPNQYAQNADILMVKATEGTGYVNNAGGAACDKVVQWAKAHGKLWGFYHNARLPQNPEAEAEYFYRNCKNYFSHGVPAIDIEQGTGFLPYIPTDYALRFATRIHTLSGVWPLIYTSASLIAYSSSASKYCGLWAAQYNSDFTYPLHGWQTLTAWQYTNSPYDTSHVYTTREGWQKIAAGSGKIDTVPEAPARKTVQQLAAEVKAGAWGNGAERRQRLTAAGYDYNAVQAEVNRTMPQQAQRRYKIVPKNGNLYSMFGNDWPRVAKLNNLKNPNLVYPGQKIYY